MTLELLLETDADAASGTAVGGPAGNEAIRLPDHPFLLDWARHALDATFTGESATGASDVDADAARRTSSDRARLEGTCSARALRAELSVRLVGAATMRALNRHWRDRDAPTNVLSFPSGLPPLVGDDGDTLLALGDVVLCPAVVAAEARAQGKPPAAHWAHLLVHGVLHLRGFDHETDEDASLMESLETRLLSTRDLPDPYRACARATNP